MASSYSALKIELLETGANSGTWGTATNVNLGDAVLGEAITGQATVDFATDADVTITLTDSSTSQAARNLRLNITESSSGVGSVRNLILGSGCQIEKFYLINNTGTGAKTIKNTSGTGISVPAGKATLVFNNGTDVVDAASYFTSLTLGSALPITSGGTGTTSTTFANLTTNVTGTLPVGNGGTGITSFGSGVATFLGTPSSANLAAALTDETGSGSAVFATSPTLVTPNLGTPSTLVLSSATGLPLSSGVTGILPVANGGTATATPSLIQGSNITITGTWPNQTIASSNSGGTVTSVGGTGTVNGISLSGSVSTSGNLTLGGTLSGVDLTSQVTGTLPIANGGTGTTSTTFANLTTNVTGTLPVANGGTSLSTLTANNVVIGNGTSAPLFVAPSTSGNVLTSNGTTWASTPPAGGSSVKISSRTSNTVLGTADNSFLIDITSGTFTQTFTAAATLGNGWFCYIRNSGTGDITLDPDASELIDGKTSYVMYPQECRLIQCSGTAFTSVVIHPFIRTVTATATLVVPPGYSQFAGTLWGGGGSGGKSSCACRFTGGGGGGAGVPFQMTSAQLIAAGFVVTVGAGGVAQTSNTNGNSGGFSTIGGYGHAYGGGGGGGNTGQNMTGGGGGGAFGAGCVGVNATTNACAYAYGGAPAVSASGTPFVRNISGGAFGGGWASTTPNGGPGSGHFGGGGGGSNADGANSVYGGGGGGGSNGTTGGTSSFGGAGGTGGAASSGTAGSAPGGGGGGTKTGASSGAGGSGRVVIFGVA